MSEKMNLGIFKCITSKKYEGTYERGDRKFYREIDILTHDNYKIEIIPISDDVVLYYNLYHTNKNDPINSRISILKYYDTDMYEPHYINTLEAMIKGVVITTNAISIRGLNDKDQEDLDISINLDNISLKGKMKGLNVAENIFIRINRTDNHDISLFDNYYLEKRRNPIFNH